MQSAVVIAQTGVGRTVVRSDTAAARLLQSAIREERQVSGAAAPKAADDADAPAVNQDLDEERRARRPERLAELRAKVAEMADALEALDAVAAALSPTQNALVASDTGEAVAFAGLLLGKLREDRQTTPMAFADSDEKQDAILVPVGEANVGVQGLRGDEVITVSDGIHIEVILPLGHQSPQATREDATLILAFQTGETLRIENAKAAKSITLRRGTEVTPLSANELQARGPVFDITL